MSPQPPAAGADDAPELEPRTASGDPAKPTTEPGAAAAERAALVAEILSARDAWEETVMPHMVAQLLTFPLTIQQLKVLVILVTDPDGNTGQGLATTVGVSLATMSGIVDRLVGQGMAERTEDPRDLRVRRVRATVEGRDTVKRLLTAQPQIDTSITEHLELDDLRALAQGMRALLRIATSRPQGCVAASDADAEALAGAGAGAAQDDTPTAPDHLRQ